MAPVDQVVLSEQSDVRREGGVVSRPAGPWTPTVDALLAHLETVGFSGAPRPVHRNAGPGDRQTVTYVEGEPASPRGWSDDGIAEVGALLRRLHEATATFTPPPDACWQPWYTHRPAGEPIISHGDPGPWNVVARQGRPVAWIDWDYAGPVDRLDEVAETARLHCQLHGEDVDAVQGLLGADRRAAQLRLFADAYGLDRDERRQLVGRMVEAAVHGAANDADEAGVTPADVGPHPMVWGVAWQARGARWLLANRSRLEAALGC